MKEKHMMLAYILRLIQTESLSGTWNDFWFTSRLLFIFEDSAAWRNNCISETWSSCPRTESAYQRESKGVVRSVIGLI